MNDSTRQISHIQRVYCLEVISQLELNVEDAKIGYREYLQEDQNEIPFTQETMLRYQFIKIKLMTIAVAFLSVLHRNQVVHFETGVERIGYMNLKKPKKTTTLFEKKLEKLNRNFEDALRAFQCSNSSTFNDECQTFHKLLNYSEKILYQLENIPKISFPERSQVETSFRLMRDRIVECVKCVTDFEPVFRSKCSFCDHIAVEICQRCKDEMANSFQRLMFKIMGNAHLTAQTEWMRSVVAPKLEGRKMHLADEEKEFAAAHRRQELLNKLQVVTRKNRDLECTNKQLSAEIARIQENLSQLRIIQQDKLKKNEKLKKFLNGQKSRMELIEEELLYQRVHATQLLSCFTRFGEKVETILETSLQIAINQGDMWIFVYIVEYLMAVWNVKMPYKLHSIGSQSYIVIENDRSELLVVPWNEKEYIVGIFNRILADLPLSPPHDWTDDYSHEFLKKVLEIKYKDKKKWRSIVKKN